ncbi:tyrosine-protein phosphatase [Streptomyces shenzhenensis]|uniref:tyrosine-protein phosphatase n=1 Tax=Streptomyces shenzhenensis TaxID=943815 RepID=UPI0033F59CA4
MEGTYNFRAVPAFRVPGGALRSARLYRSDALHELTRDGRQTLEGLGIALIVDLRDDEEAQNASGPNGERSVSVRVPVFRGADPAELIRGHGGFSLAAMYRSILRERGDALATAVGRIADAKRGAVLVHCTAGKDRTGLVIALVLAALGVAEYDILRDYAESQPRLEGEWAERMLQATPLTPDITLSQARVLISRSDPDDLRHALEFVRTAFGSASEYLHAHGLSAEQSDRLRDRLLAPSPGLREPGGGLYRY